MKFLDRLNLALRKAGMTRAALAERLNIANSTITRWNHGAEPRAEVITEIAALTGVRKEWLAAGLEPMEPTEKARTHSLDGLPGPAQSAIHLLAERLQPEELQEVADHLYSGTRISGDEAWLDLALSIIKFLKTVKPLTSP